MIVGCCSGATSDTVAVERIRWTYWRMFSANQHQFERSTGTDAITIRENGQSISTCGREELV